MKQKRLWFNDHSLFCAHQIRIKEADKKQPKTSKSCEISLDKDGWGRRRTAVGGPPLTFVA